MRQAIRDVMRDGCLPPITMELLLEIASQFEKRTHFPNCIGAINGKHICIMKPYQSGSLFHNYKSFFSITLDDEYVNFWNLLFKK